MSRNDNSLNSVSKETCDSVKDFPSNTMSLQSWDQSLMWDTVKSFREVKIQDVLIANLINDVSPFVKKLKKTVSISAQRTNPENRLAIWLNFNRRWLSLWWAQPHTHAYLALPACSHKVHLLGETFHIFEWDRCLRPAVCKNVHCAKTLRAVFVKFAPRINLGAPPFHSGNYP